MVCESIEWPVSLGFYQALIVLLGRHWGACVRLAELSQAPVTWFRWVFYCARGLSWIGTQNTSLIPQMLEERVYSGAKNEWQWIQFNPKYHIITMWQLFHEICSYRTKSVVNQDTVSLCWKYQGGSLEPSRELSVLGLRWPDGNLSVWVGGSLWPVELIRPKSFYMAVNSNARSDTEVVDRWLLRGLKVAQEDLALCLSLC